MATEHDDDHCGKIVIVAFGAGLNTGQPGNVRAWVEVRGKGDGNNSG